MQYLINQADISLRISSKEVRSAFVSLRKIKKMSRLR